MFYFSKTISMAHEQDSHLFTLISEKICFVLSLQRKVFLYFCLLTSIYIHEHISLEIPKNGKQHQQATLCTTSSFVISFYVFKIHFKLTSPSNSLHPTPLFTSPDTTHRLLGMSCCSYNVTGTLNYIFILKHRIYLFSKIMIN